MDRIFWTIRGILLYQSDRLGELPNLQRRHLVSVVYPTEGIGEPKMDAMTLPHPVVRAEIEDLICRLAGVGINEAGRELLQRLRAADPALAAELEVVWSAEMFDATHAGFAAGWQCGQRPERLIFMDTR